MGICNIFVNTRKMKIYGRDDNQMILFLAYNHFLFFFLFFDKCRSVTWRILSNDKVANSLLIFKWLLLGGRALERTLSRKNLFVKTEDGAITILPTITIIIMTLLNHRVMTKNVD